MITLGELQTNLTVCVSVCVCERERRKRESQSRQSVGERWRRAQEGGSM